MACEITYKNQIVMLTNMQFAGLIDFIIEVGSKNLRNDAERDFMNQMIRHRDENYFYPGRGFDITEDFPKTEEQMFWAKVIYDTARAIFTQNIGVHTYVFWQAQAIYQAYAIGILFQDAVREKVPGWLADSLDSIEFDRIINKKQK